MALLKSMGRMTGWLGHRGREGLIAIAVVALFMLNLNGALAAGSASISGCVWYDDNGDGVFGPGEGGLEGVTVCLCRDNDGVLVGTQTSSQDGSYQFSNLSAGDYIVQVADTHTEDLAEYALTTDSSLPISLEEREDYSDANFGYEGVAGPAGSDPTAVTLSSFMASSASQGASRWPWLAVLATLAAGGTLWIRRR